MPDEEKRIYISYKSYPIDHDFYHYFHSHGYKEEKGERNHHLDYQYNFKYSTSISNGSEENGKRRSSVSKKKDSHIIIHRKSSIKRKFRPTPTPSQAKTRNEKEFIENHQNLTQKAKVNATNDNMNVSKNKAHNSFKKSDNNNSDNESGKKNINIKDKEDLQDHLDPKPIVKKNFFYNMCEIYINKILN